MTTTTSVREEMQPFPPESKTVFGMLAQFATTGALIHAANGVREANYTRWDCHAPFAVHGLDQAMGIRRTRLPYLVLIGGLVGLVGGLGFQLWMNGVNYPILISDKPFFSVPANIPITFELTVLCAAFGAFFGMLLLNNLPLHYHPLYRCQQFRRATSDGFFLSIEANDPLFDAEKTRALLAELGAASIETVEE